MELTKILGLLAVVLPAAYGVPTQSANNLHPELLAAMKRDLGLDAQQAHARIAREEQANAIIDNVRSLAGESFAGAWLHEGEVQVGVTNQELSDAMSAAGAKPVLMDNSLSKLESAKSALDKLFVENNGLASRADAGGIASFFIDVAANKLIIESLADSRAKADELAAQVGLSGSEYEVRTVEEMPSVRATVVGGNAYLIDQRSRCSVGFSVTTGFVSAGHCGQRGARATTQGGEQLGTFSNSVFPGSADMSFVSTVSGTQLSGTVNGYGRPNFRVAGSTEAAVGASICRSGSTTGVYCGNVQSKGATVNYAEGTVTGLTRTNVCAEPGDSGGSWISGTQAQGVTSGGSGNCQSGGTTYFQPVNEILQTYRLTLVTS